MSTWKRDFGSGLIVLVPLIVLLLVIGWIYRHIASIPLISTLEPDWLFEPILPLYRVVIALVVFTTLVLAVGYFMRTTLGRIVEARIDDSINHIPALRVVYNASKLAVETALSGTEDLQNPVHLETWEGIRMTAFKTGKKTRDGKLVLFMPTAPNITSGYVIEVEPERVTDTGESVEEAMTRILSAGFAESTHQVSVDGEPGDAPSGDGVDVPTDADPVGGGRDESTDHGDASDSPPPGGRGDPDAGA
ncbi:DUF502 domain-containing protein [Halopenitus persicus]|uniref:Uncharacterized membrane protein n=1 Tax=Halopenitus persicus TaxID=1048396 RepID=A0A1H3G2K3_9EURY|nr:DUF502 domain-containing protein [Halopenitus persicus]SDX96674.1 Uncharacterized membrane protein [Halopenitus persicus]